MTKFYLYYGNNEKREFTKLSAAVSYALDLDAIDIDVDRIDFDINGETISLFFSTGGEFVLDTDAMKELEDEPE